METNRAKELVYEISNLFIKYNMGGYVVACDGPNQQSEFANFMTSPRWSTIRVVDGGQCLSISIKGKTNPVDTQSTVNMLIHTRDLLQHQLSEVNDILDIINKHAVIEESNATMKQEVVVVGKHGKTYDA